MASSVAEMVRSPSATTVPSAPSVAIVVGSGTTMPAFLSPMKAMNSPMPAPTAILSWWGIALMIAPRTPVNASSRNSTPDTKVAASAVSHGMPNPSTTVKAKKAFSPMPGAWAIGRFAHSPMTRVPSAAARQVATKTAPGSIPAASRKLGLTKTM